MFWRRKKKAADTEPPAEPLFTGVRNDDAEMQRAYALAAGSMDEFIAHIHRPGDHTCAAKLRFRDPENSERLGEERFVYLWLASVAHDKASNEFSGAFFEVPQELAQWHQVGQRLRFDGEDVFDWFVNEGGHLFGGFTMRVARSRLPPSERAAYDAYTGVTHWDKSERN